jgi:prepilin peptidase CpaA
MLEHILQNLITIVGIALFILAACSDLKTFRIPNVLVAAVALLAVTRLIVIGDPSVALYTVGASAVLLVVGFILFWQGFVGGGDAKLLTATALLVDYHDLFSFLVFMSICGAVLSLAVLVTQWSLSRQSVVVTSPDQPQPKTKLAVPYGVAIATAGGVTLLFQSPFLASFIG